MEVTHGRGYVYSIQYHIVWCVKYRHKIITEQIDNRLIEILNKIADEKIETGESGGKALRYEELIADLVATLQSQNERISELENKLGGR